MSAPQPQGRVVLCSISCRAVKPWILKTECCDSLACGSGRCGSRRTSSISTGAERNGIVLLDVECGPYLLEYANRRAAATTATVAAVSAVSSMTARAAKAREGTSSGSGAAGPEGGSQTTQSSCAPGATVTGTNRVSNHGDARCGVDDNDP